VAAADLVAAIEDPVTGDSAEDDEAAEINNNFTERQAGNMRKGSAIISVIIAIVVLLTAFGVGHGIKQVRIHRANSRAKSQPQAGLQPQRPGAAALPGGERPRAEGPRFGQRTDRQGQRPGMNDQQTSDSMAQRPEGFDSGRQPGGGRQQGMSEEERQKMKERFENMSEEERAKFREEMRQRSGGGRRPGGRGAGAGGPGPSPEEGAGPPAEGENRTSENQQSVPENQ